MNWPSIDGRNFRMIRWRRLAAVLLGIPGLFCGPSLAIAADGGGGAVRFHDGRVDRGISPAVRRGVVEPRVLPEIALGGTVVLRGSPSPNSNAGQSVLAPSGEGYGSSSRGSTGNGPPSNRPAGAALPGAGGDSELDATGFDRTGLNPRNP